MRIYVCRGAAVPTPFAGHAEGLSVSVSVTFHHARRLNLVRRIARREVFRQRGTGLNKRILRTSGCAQ